ncbi:hypothetical protein HOY82DRAFT_624874 [Tuber indicum]|nr:hypothetical protein HOY82DRAFT_624874 [Tuber indicum]
MALTASHRFVNILNATAYQWVCAAKIADRVADISWWGNSLGLEMGNKAGGIREFDVLSEKVVARWNGKGGHVTMVLKNSGTRRIAICSRSRIVNVAKAIPPQITELPLPPNHHRHSRQLKGTLDHGSRDGAGVMEIWEAVFME